MGFVQRIVVPVDLSELCRSAVASALSLAKRFEASLHFVHAAQLGPLAVSPLFRVAEREAGSARDAVSADLRDLAARARTEGLVASWELCETDPVSAVRDAVVRRRADLVVMATHGYSGFRHFLFGSVAEWMLHGVPCPIWVVKQDEPDSAEFVRRVLWASDFSAHAERAGELAATIARAFGAELEAVHAYEVPPDILPYALPIPSGFEAELRVRAEELLKRAASKIALGHQSVTTHLERGSPPTAIARRAAECGAQVIAMGTRGHTGLAHLLLGSVSERTLRLAPCSVLVVPLVGGRETPQGDRL